MKGAGSIYEILITLLLTTIVAGAGSLHFKEIKEEIELKNFSNQLRDLIYEGYLTAIREEKNHFIKPEDKKMILADEKTEKRVVLIPKAVKLTTRKEISFYSSGTISPASILIQKGDATCIIKVSLRGRIAVDC